MTLFLISLKVSNNPLSCLSLGSMSLSIMTLQILIPVSPLNLGFQPDSFNLFCSLMIAVSNSLIVRVFYFWLNYLYCNGTKIIKIF